jgi:hypothetical protein
VKIKVYHISHSKNRYSIQKNGLIPHEKTEGRIQYSPRIFISIDKEDLGFDYVNYENVDCWEFEVDSNSIKKDEFSSSKNHFYVEEFIPAEKISLIESY